MWVSTTNLENILDKQKETAGVQLPDKFEDTFKNIENRSTLVSAAAEAFDAMTAENKNNIKEKAKTEISSWTAFPDKATDKESYGAKIAVLYLYTTLNKGTINANMNDVKAVYETIIKEKASLAKPIYKMETKSINMITTENTPEIIPVQLNPVTNMNNLDQLSTKKTQSDKEPTKLYENKDPNIIFSTATAIDTYKPWDIIVWRWENSKGYNEVYRRDENQQKYIWVNADAKATINLYPEYFNNKNDFDNFKNDRKLWYEVTNEDIKNAPKIMPLRMIISPDMKKILEDDMHLFITKKDNIITISSDTSWLVDSNYKEVEANIDKTSLSLNDHTVEFENSTHISIDQSPDKDWWYTMRETDIIGNVTEVKIRVKPIENKW